MDGPKNAQRTARGPSASGTGRSRISLSSQGRVPKTPSRLISGHAEQGQSCLAAHGVRGSSKGARDDVASLGKDRFGCDIGVNSGNTTCSKILI